MWSKNRGASFNLLPGLHLEGRRGAATSLSCSNLSVELLKLMKESHQNHLFLPKKIQSLWLPSLNFNKNKSYHLSWKKRSVKLSQTNFSTKTSLMCFFSAILYPHHKRPRFSNGTWNWKDHGDFDGKGCQPWTSTKTMETKTYQWKKTPACFDIPNMLLVTSYHFKNSFFRPCHRKEFKNTAWFSKGFLNLFDSFRWLL